MRNKMVFQIDAEISVYQGGFHSTPQGGSFTYDGSEYVITDVNIDRIKDKLEQLGYLPVHNGYLKSMCEKKGVIYTKIYLRIFSVINLGGYEVSKDYITTQSYIGENNKLTIEDLIAELE